MAVLRSMALFFLAGLYEIGGVYLIWGWFKKGLSPDYGLLGSILLVIYGHLHARPARRPLFSFAAATASL